MSFQKLYKLRGCLVLIALGLALPSFSSSFQQKIKSASVAGMITHRSIPTLSLCAGLAICDFHKQSKKLNGYSFSKYVSETSSGIRKDKLGKAVQASGLLSAIAIGSDSLTAYRNRFPADSASLKNLKEAKKQIDNNLKLRKKHETDTTKKIESLTRQIEAEKQNSGNNQRCKDLEKELLKYQVKMKRLKAQHSLANIKDHKTLRRIASKLNKELEKEKNRKNGKSVVDTDESEIDIDEDVEDIDIDDVSDIEPENDNEDDGSSYDSSLDSNIDLEHNEEAVEEQFPKVIVDEIEDDFKTQASSNSQNSNNAHNSTNSENALVNLQGSQIVQQLADLDKNKKESSDVENREEDENDNCDFKSVNSHESNNSRHSHSSKGSKKRRPKAIPLNKFLQSDS
jgi:hypothetical protein